MGNLGSCGDPGGRPRPAPLTGHPSPSSHLQDLKDITHNVHYENYRIVRLKESHALPRGPGWVNLAPAPSPAPGPAPTGTRASPGPAKVCRWAEDNSDEDF